MFDFVFKCRYDPKQFINIDPEGKTLQISIKKQKMEDMPLWVKGLRVFPEERFSCFWSQLDVCFNVLSSGKLLYKFSGLSSYEDHITDLIISDKYFVVATVFGNINVWKLGKTTEPIHQFTGAHTKCCSSLQNHPVKTMFMSLSLDCTLRIFCLDVSVPL